MRHYLHNSLRVLFLSLAVFLSMPMLAEPVEIDGINYELNVEAKQATVRGKIGSKYSGEIVIPESVEHEGTAYSVTSIGGWAFSGCSGLTSVTIGNSVTSIGNDAFYYCSSLTSVTIGNSVTSIRDNAFFGCSGMTSVTIGNSVTSIGNDAFANCHKLTSVHISDIAAWCNIYFGNSFSNPLYYAHHLYMSGEEVKELVIPNSVTSIGERAFESCSGLTSVTIPNIVTSIGDYAFLRCSSLTSVHISDIAAWCNIDFGNSFSNPLYYAHHLYMNGEEVKDLVIPNSVTNIGSYAFAYCDSLTSVAIGNSVESIGKLAFNHCSTLSSVIIPNSVTSIGNDAFSYCRGLTSVTIPNSVNSIGDYAFASCSGLTKITIGNGVTSIGDYAFRDCSGLTSVTIPNSVTSIGECAFGYCSGLTSVTIPNSVTSIGSGAFSNCSGLTSIEIPNSVMSIGKDGFFNCSSLTSLTIGDNIKSIEESAFHSCEELEHIYCTALTPPTIGLNTFDKKDANYSYTTIYVPRISLDAYKSADVWKDLENYIFKPMVYMHLVSLEIDGIVIKSDSLEYGTDIILPEIEEKEGYTFVWDNIAEKVPNHDFVIQGKYVPNNYAITYVVDGDTIATDSTAYGSAITLLEEPAKEGHTFLGWSEAPETMPANDITITGEYKVNTYTVMYVVDGEVIESYPVEYGKELVIMPLAPEKEGHTFMGWSELPATMPAEDVTVTGTFKVNTYAVTYVVDGVTVATDSVVYGTAVTLIDELEKEGYSFSWSEAPETMPANDITITGEWSINSYLVTFIIDGEVYATDSVEYGAAITLPEVPEKENSTFEWEETPTTMPASDVTIYGNYVSGIGGITVSGKADVYTLNGMLYKRDVDLNKLNIELPKGVYIINGKKYLVR